MTLKHTSRGKSYKSYRDSLLALLLVLAVCLGLGCAAGDGDDSDDSPPDATGQDEIFEFEATTDDSGRAVGDFTLPAGTTKFSVTARMDASGSVRFNLLEDEDGNDFLSPGGEQISFGEDFLPSLNSVSAPSRNQDPQVDPNQRFTVSASAISSGQSPRRNTPLRFTINSRPDNDFSGGALMVNIFYVGSIGQEGASKSAVSVAKDEMSRIYGNAGIRVRFVDRDIDGPGIVPSPFDGASFYESASSLAEIPSVNVFIAGDVEDQEGLLLGISGGLPGAPIPSPRSAVVVSIITGAGSNGEYNSEELRLLGESMAHEVGHFMGLFHPIDFGGNSVAAEDPLSDTSSCNNETDCESDSSLTSNLMYPTPVFDGNSLVPQNGLSAQQKGVLNRYVAVD